MPGRKVAMSGGSSTVDCTNNIFDALAFADTNEMEPPTPHRSSRISHPTLVPAASPTKDNIFIRAMTIGNVIATWSTEPMHSIVQLYDTVVTRVKRQEGVEGWEVVGIFSTKYVD